MSCGLARPETSMPRPGGHCRADTPPASGPSSGWPDKISAASATSRSRWPNCSYDGSLAAGHPARQHDAEADVGALREQISQRGEWPAQLAEQQVVVVHDQEVSRP